MSASPIFSIEGGEPGAAAMVAASTSFSATLDSIDNVRTCAWSVASTDELSSTDDYVLVVSGDVNQTVTSTSLGAGTALLLKATINNGRDSVTGEPSDSTVATGKVWVPTAAALEVGTHGEQLESDARFGTTKLLNIAIRSIDSAIAASASSRVPVDAASTGNLVLSGNQTIDGVVNPARVLAKDQTVGSENGLYATGAGAWTRATDADMAAKLPPGATVFVKGGTLDRGDWTLATPGPITLGTTPLLFVKQLPSANVRMFEAVGDAATDDSAKLTTTHAASKDVTYPKGSYRVAATASFGTATTTVHRFAAEASVYAAAGQVVTLRGQIEGNGQIFTGPGSFLLPDVPFVKVEWFGAVGNDSTDCKAALLAAIAAVGGTSAEVRFGDGVFRLTATQLVAQSNGLTIRGCGQCKVGVDTGGTVLKAAGAQAYVLEVFSQQMHIENLTLDGNFQTTQAVLYWRGQTQCGMRNVNVTRTWQGTSSVYTVNAGTNVFTTGAAHGLVDGQQVWFDATVTIWANYIQNQIYFVRDATPTTFKVSLTSGGAAVAVGTTGAATQTVHPFGAALVQLGNAANDQCDTNIFVNVQLYQDYTSFANIAGTGWLSWGSNALQNQFFNCSIYSAIDGYRLKDGAGGQFEGCTYFSTGPWSRGAWVRDGWTQNVVIHAHYIETAPIPLVTYINDPGSDRAFTWTISQGESNSASAHVKWDKRQPLVSMGNVHGGFFKFVDTGDQKTVLVGDQFSDVGGYAFHGYEGPMSGVTRIGCTHTESGAPALPNLIGTEGLKGLPGVAGDVGENLTIGGGAQGDASHYAGATIVDLGPLVSGVSAECRWVYGAGTVGIRGFFSTDAFLLSTAYRLYLHAPTLHVVIDSAGDPRVQCNRGGTGAGAMQVAGQLWISTGGNAISGFDPGFRMGANANEGFILGNDDDTANRSHAGGAGYIRVDTSTAATAGDFVYFNAANGADNAAITYAEAFRVKQSTGSIKWGGGDPLKRHWKGGASPSLGTINAGTVATFTFTATGVNTADNASVSVSPLADPGAGLVWSAWVSGTDTVEVRVANPTASNIVSTDVAWVASVWVTE